MEGHVPCMHFASGGPTTETQSQQKPYNNDTCSRCRSLPGFFRLSLLPLRKTPHLLTRQVTPALIRSRTFAKRPQIAPQRLTLHPLPSLTERDELVDSTG